MSSEVEDLGLTDDEQYELQKYLTGATAPSPEEKHNVHTFLNEVATSKDTTKTGYLQMEEVGVPQNPVRTYKKLALISEMIMENPFFKEFFEKESENITSTSLSRDAKLLDLAVINRRQLENVTKKKQKPKGFFRKKEDDSDE